MTGTWKRGHNSKGSHGVPPGYGGTRKPRPDRYVVNAETGCWEWIGGLTPYGYGSLRVHKRLTSAHRYHYIARYGEVEAGIDLHHLCHNRRCCNPEHVVPVNRDEHAGGLGHGHLTRDDVREIRRLYATGTFRQWELAERYGCSRPAISNAVTGARWKAVA